MTRWIVTTCKGRLDQLRRSLPTWRAHLPGWRVLVADWGDPDCSAEWAESVGLASLDCEALGRDCALWHKTACWNLAVPHAVSLGAEWLALIDADNILQGPPGSVARAFDQLTALGPGHWGLEVVPNHPGLIVCHAKDWEACGGSSEEFIGWGCEDWDLRARLTMAGARPVSLPIVVHYQRHDANARARFQPNGARSSAAINSRLCYRRLRQLETKTGRRIIGTELEGLVFNYHEGMVWPKRVTEWRDRAWRECLVTGDPIVWPGVAA